MSSSNQSRCVLVTILVASSIGVAFSRELPETRDVTSSLTAAENEECKAEGQNALSKWFTCHHIKVRESFENEQSQSNPAVAAFDSGNSQQDYYKVDLGVRFRTFQPFESLLWYPTVEFHRSTAEKEPVNKKSAALKLEYYPFVGDVSGGGLPTPKRRIKPYLLLEGKATRDSQEHETVGSASLLTGFRTSGQFSFPGPGQGVRCSTDGPVCFRYRPYLGIEHFDRLPVGPEGATSLFNGDFAVAKVSFEYYPLQREKYKPVQIVAEGQYRNRLSSEGSVERETETWSVALNWYLDEAESIAVGIDYEDGRSPANNFVYGHRYGLAFKFKLNPAD